MVVDKRGILLWQQLKELKKLEDAHSDSSIIIRALDEIYSENQ
jgi:hypothetical protein